MASVTPVLRAGWRALKRSPSANTEMRLSFFGKHHVTDRAWLMTALHGGNRVSGRSRLAAGEPIKRSQRLSRRAARVPTAIGPIWRPGDKVRWREYAGFYMRDVDEAEAEIMIGARKYRVQRRELSAG